MVVILFCEPSLDPLRVEYQAGGDSEIITRKGTQRSKNQSFAEVELRLSLRTNEWKIIQLLY